MKRGNIFLLLVGLIGLAVFIMPDAFSMFTGQHNFYDGVSCNRCHSSEYDDLHGSEAGIAHIRAASNTNYTTYLSVGGSDYDPSTGTIYSVENKVWIWDGSVWANGSTSMLITLDHNSNDVIDGDEVCHLCHNSSLSGKPGRHAVTVRTCDDDWCHGNRNFVLNDPVLFDRSQTSVNVGVVLNDSGNVHNSFYVGMSNDQTGYIAGDPFNHTMGNVVGNYFSKGYWACISCHSEVQVEVEISKEEYDHSDGIRRKYV